MLFDQINFITLLAIAGTFVCAAAYWDVREKRIPNRLTFPMFIAGWIYQFALSCMEGWQHLGNGLAGFAIGFGILFVLWFVGSGGGGDVKLMGALGVWLGGWMTIWVLLSTLVIIVAVMLFRRLSSVVRHGNSSSASSGTSKGAIVGTTSKTGRRLMTFAGPVAVATWGVLLTSPWWNSVRFPSRTSPAAVVQQIPH